MEMRRIGQLLFIFLSVVTCNAINYVFDEYLFSKDTWLDWKIENPLAGINPSDIVPKVKEGFPGVDQAEFNSLDGTNPRVPSTQKIMNLGGGMELDPLDEDFFVEPAAKAAQCTTCHALVAVVWPRLTAAVMAGKTVTTSYVKKQLTDACEDDAPDAMLRKYSIYKMHGGDAGPSVSFFVVRERRDAAGVKGAGSSEPTEAEEDAVEMSCKTLVKEHRKDLVSVLIAQLENYRKEALRLLVKYDRDGGSTLVELEPVADDAQEASDSSDSSDSSSRGSSGSGSGSGSRGQLPRLDGSGGGSIRLTDADADDDYVDPDDLDEEGNVVERRRGGKEQGAAATGPRPVAGLVVKVNPDAPECENLNPQCETWAKGGECTSNPNYMIGTEKHRGQCRKACGVCQSGNLLSDSPELLSELESVSSALLLAVKNLGCGAGGPCLTGVSGMGVGPGLMKQQTITTTTTTTTTTSKELPPGMKELPGGFVLGKPWWGQPHIQSVPTSLRKPLTASIETVTAAGGMAASGGSSSSSGNSGSSSSEGGGGGSLTGPGRGEVDQVLAPVLGHKLLSIPSDFFIYEYLYKNHTRHFHQDDAGKLTEDWLLGRFSRESVSPSTATGEAAGLEELDLLPGSSHARLLNSHTWPYVKQVYAGGDECVLGGGRRVVRRVEVRIACSPDAKLYMLVREPDFCTYTFVIFVPQLCELGYYKPRPKAGSSSSSSAPKGEGDSGREV